MMAWASAGAAALVVLVAVITSCSTPEVVQDAVTLDAMVARRVGGKFMNPQGSPTVQNTWRDHTALWWWASFGAAEAELSPAVPAGHVLGAERAAAMLASQAAQDTITWLGHAAFLIRLNGKAILVDPFLSERASFLAGAGPKRFVGPGLGVDQLPKIDALLISHNHYDHLDLRTLELLSGKAGIQVFVPLGLGELVRSAGFDQVTEMSWGDVRAFGGLTIRSVPAVHFSSRGLFDGDESLWTGYLIESSKQRLYFAGDTAFHEPLFQRMRQQFGPVDVALVPIGAYEPAKLMVHVHTTPEQAARLGHILGATTLVGMHWGTIVLSTEPPFEPPSRFRAAGLALGYANEALWLPAVGETRPMPDR